MFSLFENRSGKSLYILIDSNGSYLFYPLTVNLPVLDKSIGWFFIQLTRLRSIPYFSSPLFPRHFSRSVVDKGISSRRFSLLFSLVTRTCHVGGHGPLYGPLNKFNRVNRDYVHFMYRSTDSVFLTCYSLSTLNLRSKYTSNNRQKFNFFHSVPLRYTTIFDLQK